MYIWHKRQRIDFLVEASVIQTEVIRINRGHGCATDLLRLSGPMSLIFNFLLSSADIGSRTEQKKITKITQNGANFFPKLRIFVGQFFTRITVKNWHVNIIRGK
jgi:hypothetical protein